MKNCWKDKKVNFFSIFLLGIILMNTEFILFAKSNSNFNPGLEKGTQILTVSYYNEQAWKNVVSTAILPNDWFGGEANKLGAKYKSTIHSWSNSSMITRVVFTNLVFTDEILLLFLNISNFGYDYRYISQSYPEGYLVWKIGSMNWNFTTSEFNLFKESCYLTKCIQFIIQNPHDFNEILIDYNDYASKVNNDTTLQSLGISIPFMDGDDLVWNFIIRRFAVARPINDYLSTMTEILNCKNTTVQGNTLIYKKRGIQDYNIEVAYNKYGTVDSISMKNSDNELIFKITSFYPANLFYIILGFLVVFTLGIIIVALLIKKRRFKIYKMLLENLKGKKDKMGLFNSKSNIKSIKLFFVH